MKQENDDPPLLEMVMVILTAVMFLSIGIIIGSSFTQVKKCRSQKTVSTTSMSILQGNSLLAYSNPNTFRLRILACRGGYPQVLGKMTDKIIFCESSGNPRAFNKKSGAKGLLQVIPKSKKFCEKGLGRKLDMFDPNDNLLCGEYLYQHGKLSHWRASKKCWNN